MVVITCVCRSLLMNRIINALFMWQLVETTQLSKFKLTTKATSSETNRNPDIANRSWKPEHLM